MVPHGGLVDSRIVSGSRQFVNWRFRVGCATFLCAGGLRGSGVTAIPGYAEGVNHHSEGNRDDGREMLAREAKVAVFHTAERRNPRTGLPERDAGSARHDERLKALATLGHLRSIGFPETELVGNHLNPDCGQMPPPATPTSTQHTCDPCVSCGKTTWLHVPQGTGVSAALSVTSGTPRKRLGVGCPMHGADTELCRACGRSYVANHRWVEEPQSSYSRFVGHHRGANDRGRSATTGVAAGYWNLQERRGAKSGAASN